MKTVCLFALLLFSVLHSAEQPDAPVQEFFEAYCVDCYDSETKKGGLDLTTLKLDAAGFETWVKVHDRVRSGKMPPKKKPRSEPKEFDAAMASLSRELIAADTAREQRDGRARPRRLNRVEFEVTWPWRAL